MRTAGRSSGRVEKMSKSKKNVIDPNALLERYGADTTRLFCLFAAPPGEGPGVERAGGGRGVPVPEPGLAPGVPVDQPIRNRHGLSRGGRTIFRGQLRDLYKKTHQTIAKVTQDIEDRFHFNTAISAVMELVNAMYAFEPGDSDEDTGAMRFAVESVVLLLSPIVPHFAEEIWAALGNTKNVLLEPWPEFREDALAKDELEVVLQVNGKLRSRLTVAADVSEQTLREMAVKDERVLKFTEGKSIRKVIVVGKKLVNIVAG